MPDLTLPLTELERIVLSVTATGEDMLAIGSWEAPVKALAEKGLLRKVTTWPGNGGYRITPAGEAAFEAMETEEMRGMVEEHNARVRERDAPVIDGEIVKDGDNTCQPR